MNRKFKQYKHEYTDILCSRCGAVMRQVRSDIYNDLKKSKEYRKTLKGGLCDACMGGDAVAETNQQTQAPEQPIEAAT